LHFVPFRNEISTLKTDDESWWEAFERHVESISDIDRDVLTSILESQVSSSARQLRKTAEVFRAEEAREDFEKLKQSCGETLALENDSDEESEIWKSEQSLEDMLQEPLDNRRDEEVLAEWNEQIRLDGLEKFQSQCVDNQDTILNMEKDFRKMVRQRKDPTSFNQESDASDGSIHSSSISNGIAQRIKINYTSSTTTPTPERVFTINDTVEDIGLHFGLNDTQMKIFKILASKLDFKRNSSTAKTPYEKFPLRHGRANDKGH
jgi:hypothetical protein